MAKTTSGAAGLRLLLLLPLLGEGESCWRPVSAAAGAKFALSGRAQRRVSIWGGQRAARLTAAWPWRGGYGERQPGRLRPRKGRVSGPIGTQAGRPGLVSRAQAGAAHPRLVLPPSCSRPSSTENGPCSCLGHDRSGSRRKPATCPGILFLPKTAAS